DDVGPRVRDVCAAGTGTHLWHRREHTSRALVADLSATMAHAAAKLKGGAMDGLHSPDSGWTLDFLAAFHLISACERLQVNAMSREVSLAACLESAETIHLHIKLDDTDRLACAALEAAGGVLDHGRRGFVKYRMPGGVN